MSNSNFFFLESDVAEDEIPRKTTDEPLFGPVPPWAVGAAAGGVLLLLIFILVPIFIVGRRKRIRAKAAKSTRHIHIPVRPLPKLPEVVMVREPPGMCGASMSLRSVTPVDLFTAKEATSLVSGKSMGSLSKQDPFRSVAPPSRSITIASTSPPPTMESKKQKSKVSDYSLSETSKERSESE